MKWKRSNLNSFFCLLFVGLSTVVCMLFYIDILQHTIFFRCQYKKVWGYGSILSSGILFVYENNHNQSSKHETRLSYTSSKQ